jgi:hypothetical protein
VNPHQNDVLPANAADVRCRSNEQWLGNSAKKPIDEICRVSRNINMKTATRHDLDAIDNAESATLQPIFAAGRPLLTPGAALL